MTKSTAMLPSGRILLVDDDRPFNDVYRELLAEEGYAVESAYTVDEARRRLTEPDWDLALLDRKLQGLAGPDTGMDLIAEVQRRSPGTRVILITGYADAASVERAFAAGVYDYIEKNEYFDAMLKVKARNALEAPRERRIAALANGRREEAILALWALCAGEQNPHRKGRLLEDLILVIFKSIAGFERAELHLRSENEEMDIVVPNESVDPFWQKESQYFLVECKNWSGKVDPKELVHFQGKIEKRHERCRLGFFIAPGGFTRGIESELAAARRDPIMMVVLGAEELRQLVEAGSGAARSDLLKAFHRASVVRG